MHRIGELRKARQLFTTFKTTFIQLSLLFFAGWLEALKCLE